MKNIIVVECLSTGTNYIGDIVNRGYNPVVLELEAPDDDIESYKEHMESYYKNIHDDFDMIFERDSYEETLEVVRKWEPELIIPGSERGVILATKLANDLNLLCNPIENLDAMTLKDKMQDKLAEAGLRHIKGKSIRTLEDAIEFYDEEGLDEVVVKPVYSAGTNGVHLCSNKDEMIEAINKTFGHNNIYGEKIEELVIQERIKGEEYFVNTASCDGIHRVTLIWKYHKVETPDGSIIYDTIETVNELSLGESEMVEYAYKVADTLGIKYGPVHGEYMLDDDGPVLIEVNCRPAGCSMPAEYLDRIAGHHETDEFLDCYLKPKRFHEKLKQKYRLLAHGALKIFIVPEDTIAKSAPMNNISPKLKSFYKSNMETIEDTEIFYIKTEDLESSCGFIYMVHKDEGILRKDIEILRQIERNAFSLVLSDRDNLESHVDEEEIVEKIRKVVSMTEDYGTGLLVTDQFLDDVNIVQIPTKKLKDLNGEFDYVIINLNKSIVKFRDDISVNIILNILSSVRVGGSVFVPETTYRYLPDGRKGIEALMKILDLRIEVPPYGLNTGVIASREHF